MCEYQGMTVPDPSPKTCFLISPIGEEGSPTRQRSDLVKNDIVQRALVPEFVDVVSRADENTNPGEITPTIISSILEADLIVADLTDANPNVYYEVAIAHAYDKPTIHIRKAGEPLPFDIKDVRVFEYGDDLHSGLKAQEAIAASANEILHKGSIARTPVSGGRAAVLADQGTDPDGQIAAELLSRMSSLEAAVGRIADRGFDPTLNEAVTEFENALRRSDLARGELALLRNGLPAVDDSEGETAAGRIGRAIEAQTARLSEAEAELQRQEERLLSLFRSRARHPSRRQVPSGSAAIRVAWDAAAKGQRPADN